MRTFADKIIDFNTHLIYSGELPPGFRVMNPFADNPECVDVMTQFYRKYYSDNHPRRWIIGINPGRYGAGVTGVPFTDTRRLLDVCGIHMLSAESYEVSAAFIYEMIAAYGGAQHFYHDIYINSLFPLAIIRHNPNGRWVNANYYDDTTLCRMVEPFIIESVEKQLAMGLDASHVFVMGKKNAQFIAKLNKRLSLFGQITVLEHPRYIQQYKHKEKQKYIEKYIHYLTEI